MIFQIWLIGAILTFIAGVAITAYENKKTNKLFKIPVYQVSFSKALGIAFCWPFFILQLVIETIIEKRG